LLPRMPPLAEYARYSSKEPKLPRCRICIAGKPPLPACRLQETKP